MGKEVFTTPRGIFAVDIQADKKFATLFKQGTYQHDDDLDMLIASGAIDSNSIAADIGAHIGTTAVPFSEIAHTVYAFEPNPASAATLRENIALNKRQNIVVHQLGLSDHKTSAHAQVPNSNSAATSTLVEGGDIPVDTLDAMLSHVALTFIKIDVEGMEPQILRGSQRIIASARPVILFEVNLTGLAMHGNTIGDLASFFKHNEYTLYLVAHGTLMRVPSLSLVAALLEPRMYFFRIHSGVFNVLAFPKEKLPHVQPVSAAATTLRLFASLCGRVVAKVL